MIADVWRRLRRENFPRIALLAFGILLSGAVLVTGAESSAGGGAVTFGDALWYAVVTMTSTGYGDVIPATLWGRLVGVMLMFGGLTVLSVVTATVASVLVARRIKEERGLETLKLKGHLLVCGWNPYVERVLDAVFAVGGAREVVLVNELAEEQAAEILARQQGRTVRFVRGDPASEAVLRRANINEARAAIVVADASRGMTTASDDRTTLVTLTLKSIRPELRVTVEALDDRSEPHLRRAGADDIVISGEFNGFLLSSAAVSPGISQVVRPLLSLSGTQLRRIAVPVDLVGKSYGEVVSALRARDGFQAIAIVREARGLTLDQLLSDDTSLIDHFIKEQFSEAGREFLQYEGSGTRAIVNPPDTYEVGEQDGIIGIPRGS
ncbi:MAG: NAD-binding protein [Chloroflexota bacterium]